MASLGTLGTLPRTLHVLCLSCCCGWPTWPFSLERGLGTTFLVHAIVMTERTQDQPLGKAGSQHGLWGIAPHTHMANGLVWPRGRAAALANLQPIAVMGACR